MTKLALKNQVDDLLDEFRAFYQGKKKTTLRELRHSYDLLMLKYSRCCRTRIPHWPKRSPTRARPYGESSQTPPSSRPFD